MTLFVVMAYVYCQARDQNDRADDGDSCRLLDYFPRRIK